MNRQASLSPTQSSTALEMELFDGQLTPVPPTSSPLQAPTNKRKRSGLSDDNLEKESEGGLFKTDPASSATAHGAAEQSRASSACDDPRDDSSESEDSETPQPRPTKRRGKGSSAQTTSKKGQIWALLSSIQSSDNQAKLQQLLRDIVDTSPQLHHNSAFYGESGSTVVDIIKQCAGIVQTSNLLDFFIMMNFIRLRLALHKKSKGKRKAVPVPSVHYPFPVPVEGVPEPRASGGQRMHTARARDGGRTQSGGVCGVLT
ncbi:hypothetical protein B0H17DRAFT_1330262 [Mycena rosella]|uniref:Uncharacterized protein n=1 Tax=Mycena rosella TaxID=1033263 RepID=A0AAD7DKP3_MYCRO|nr:hypothetical protein B0H17DRAFT_1330262 [Mycena rosella]